MSGAVALLCLVATDSAEPNSFENLIQKFQLIYISRRIQKFTRQNNGCAENNLSGRDVVLLMWGSIWQLFKRKVPKEGDSRKNTVYSQSVTFI
jgi:hypothetical protein